MRQMKIYLKSLVLPLSLAAAFAFPTTAGADVVKIALIDPLSGPFAPIGQNEYNSFHMIADTANAEKWAGEHKIEFIPFDNKGSPQESLTQFKNIIDQGIRYI